MAENEWLAERFEAHRPRLMAVASRMLGSTGEVEDAVQEAWLRLQRTNADGIDNLAGWLTTVVGRVCLDSLRSRTVRREDPLDADGYDLTESPVRGPEGDAVLADQVGVALMAVLDTLGPDERLAFVLHDIFKVPHREIATILDRTPAASKMLASRARRRVQRTDGSLEDTTTAAREIVEAFLLAARGGDFDQLISLLHPEIALRIDETAADMGAPAGVVGAESVAQHLSGSAQAARLALIDGVPGAAWAPGGQVRSVFLFTVDHNVITDLQVIADPTRVGEMDVEFLNR